MKTDDALLRAYNTHVLDRTVKRKQLCITEKSISQSHEAIIETNASTITLCLLPENNVFVGTEENMFSVINVVQVAPESHITDIAVLQHKDTPQRYYWHADVLDNDRLIFSAEGACIIFNWRTNTVEKEVPVPVDIPEYGRKNLLVFGGRYIIIGTNTKPYIVDILQPSSSIELNEHASNNVRCVEMLPNYKLASGGDDKEIVIWDLREQKIDRVLKHDQWVWTMAYLNNEILVSGSSSSLYVWNYVTGALLYKHADLGAWLRRIVYLSDQLICVTGDTGIMFVYDVSKRIVVTHFNGPHTGDALGAEVLDDGRMITCSRDGSIRIWRMGHAMTPGRLFKRLFATQAFKDCAILTYH
jgi:hypothetical protein